MTSQRPPPSRVLQQRGDRLISAIAVRRAAVASTQPIGASVAVSVRHAQDVPECPPVPLTKYLERLERRRDRKVKKERCPDDTALSVRHPNGIFSVDMQTVQETREKLYERFPDSRPAPACLLLVKPSEIGQTKIRVQFSTIARPLKDTVTPSLEQLPGVGTENASVITQATSFNERKRPAADMAAEEIYDRVLRHLVIRDRGCPLCGKTARLQSSAVPVGRKAVPQAVCTYCGQYQ